MKLIILVCCFAGLAYAAPRPQVQAALARITEYTNDLDIGKFFYHFKTENGIEVEAQGKLEGEGTPEEGIEVSGHYSYQDDTGKVHTVFYTAGKDGFYVFPDPSGTTQKPAHLPSAALASLSGYARSDDGTNVVEQGHIENEGTDDEALEVEGQYSYQGDDGKMYVVSYTAGKNGFEPHGEHIPPAASVRESPPQLGIPSAALASLAGK